MAGGTRTARAESHDVTLPVVVENQAGLPAAVVERAAAFAAVLYRQAHISIRWIDRDKNSATAGLSIVIAAGEQDAGLDAPPHAMGVTPSAGDGTRGSVAYVFQDRAVRFAREAGIELSIVIGLGMAHELGHLLLPVNAHSRLGIMTAVWDRAGVEAMWTGTPAFGPQQARLLRARVAERAAAGAVPPAPTR